MQIKLVPQFWPWVVVGAQLTACNPSPSQPLVPPGAPSALKIEGQPTGPAGASKLSLKEQNAKLEQRVEQSGQVTPLDRSDSLLGPDLNNNGVRDDIDAYIGSLNLTPVQSKAAFQDARAMQMTLAVDITDKTALQQVGEIGMASANCLGDAFPNSQLRMQISQAIESKTANTKIRVTKYLAYNAASSGSVTTLPSGDTCEK